MSFIWILGPCSLESDETFFKALDQLNMMLGERNWYMKSSFDKANRTRMHSQRGPGLEYSIDVWKAAKQQYPNVQLLTDVHETYQVERLVGLIDCIQIPAFLCRQTDLLVESAKHFEKINIKKGQWLGPINVGKSVEKIREVNEDCDIWISDRGSNFGYHDLFVNYGIVDELKKSFDRVLLDCTHATQRTEEIYGLGGDQRLAERYFITAPAFNYDGVFAEVHPNPAHAISDVDCQLDLARIRQLVVAAEQVMAITDNVDDS
ncbi:MAG: 3-deoxy-8-phosphooctulonate synthase [Acidiferrobacteraceae bacterium]|nr:3-deoxy-8-phosphooctulonate synthase [Acidiferrobacteraceae bacterium]|tara:strand:+ start:4292 stop:5077 length:786 start_codon:yes stop_codon:yes gene_type:complete